MHRRGDLRRQRSPLRRRDDPFPLGRRERVADAAGQRGDLGPPAEAAEHPRLGGRGALGRSSGGSGRSRSGGRGRSNGRSRSSRTSGNSRRSPRRADLDRRGPLLEPRLAIDLHRDPPTAAHDGDLGPRAASEPQGPREAALELAQVERAVDGDDLEEAVAE